ncbi:autotransporter-associated beta strand repeat-containing protein [Bradyrhizobium sp. CER78]|uniref:autotransporter-associated beta strand repeat-containing protein n=1 Tax=Bradyrhizobium sp. CER78 TaxID=3039162 RepID=UPI00244CC12C|nr:autotransporter-associated beta strand repeat-containing protein [Bradyrhizobium sp. CER78]MDH2384437.1 autotransporter-associated beta strand repeat-containing protein [Bradyrhizobium sp. CER78]
MPGATGLNGQAGVGVFSASGGTIINAGTIEGGLNPDGSRANAITFGGGNNWLELQAGSNIIGNVVARPDPNNPNTFALGGNQNASFDLSGLGHQYQGFTNFAKEGASIWTLSGWSTVAGSVAVDQGGLTLGAAAFLESQSLDMSGTGAIHVTSGGRFMVDRQATIDPGTGNQSAMIDVNGVNAVFVAGRLDVEAGTVSIANGGSARINSDFVLAGAAGSSAALHVSGVGSSLQGNLNIGALGSGNVMIDSGARVEAANVNIGNITDLSTTSTVTVTGAGSTLKSGQISIGNGALTLSNGGEVFGGRNPIVVSQAGGYASLNIGAAAGAAAVAPGTLYGTDTLAINSHGTLVFNHTSSNYAFANKVTGNGAINLLAGTTIFSGDDSQFTGNTTVSGSTLRMASTGNLGGALAVNSGGRLEGLGAVGSTTINSGGTIAPTSGGAININGNLALQLGSTFEYHLADPSSSLSATPVSDTSVINVIGNLALNGANLDVLGNGAAPSIGYHRLISYTGSLSETNCPTNCGLKVRSSPPSSPIAYSYTVDTTTYHNVDLLVTPDGLNVLQLWGGGTNGVGMGSGTWNAGNANWLNPIGGIVPSNWGSGYGIFRGPGGTVTVDGAQTSIGLQFAGGAYTLAPGTAGSLNLVNSTAVGIAVPGIDVLAGETATVGVTITGTDGLQKTSDGTLILSGANTYTGGTIISGGVLQISSDTNLGAAGGGLTFDSATLQTTASVVSGRAVNLRGGGAFDVASGTISVFGGAVTGAGSLTKLGDGTLELQGNNSWTGGTLVTAGTLRADTPGALPAFTDYVLTGGTLDLNNNNLTVRSLSGTGGQVALGTATLGINQTIDSYFGGAISGTGGLTKSGSGLLILTGSSSYSGGTNIMGGTIGIVSDSNLGAATGAVTMWDGTTLATLNDVATTRNIGITGTSTLYTLAGTTLGVGGQISGGGTLVKDGGGKLMLTGANNYSGGTTINAGTLQLGNGGASGSITGDVLNHGILAFYRVDASVFAGAISGSGSVQQAGAGTTILTGNNSYSGGTTIAMGTLQLGNGGTSGSITGNVTNNGTLAFNRSDAVTFDGAITGAGALNQLGSGTTILTANNSYSGGTTITAGTLQLGNGGMSGWINGSVTDNGTLAFNRSDAMIFDGRITGVGKLVQLGPGTTVLTNNNSYLGGTTVAGGVLMLGNGGTWGAITGNVTNNGVLAFNRSDTSVFAGNVTGTGLLLQLGVGATVLTGTSSYGAGTLIAAGTLQLGDGGTTGSITGSVTNNGVLAFNRSDNSVFAGAISGSGSVQQLGAGTTVLTGANTFGGGTTIAAGTLQLGNGGTSGSILGNVQDQGTLAFDRSNTLIFTGCISGAGALAQIGAGTTVLAGNNSFTGGTTISAGELIVGNGFASGTLAGNVANSGILAFYRADTSEFTGAISGTGSVQQIGSGTTRLIGTSSYTGPTDIYAGRLSVNGSIASSSLTTAHRGGTLGGNGVVGPTLIDGGTLSPGNSVGTLTVQGNLTFTATAAYFAEINSTTSDRANVSGTAKLGGTVVIAAYPGTDYVKARYTLLNAAAGVNGTFGRLVNTNLPANFDPSLSYDPNNVYLDFKLTYPSGLNINQQSVANGLSNGFNAVGAVPLAAGGLTPAGLTLASGELSTGVQQTTIDAMGMFMSAMTDPFVASRVGWPSPDGLAAQAYASATRTKTDNPLHALAAMPGTASATSFDQRWGVWAAAFGGARSTMGNDIVGSNTLTDRVYGTAVGADYRLSADTLLGFAMAGGGTSFGLANGLGSGRSDLFQAGVYAYHRIGAAYLSAALAYGWQDVTTDRTLALAGIDRLRGGLLANAFSGRLEGGYRFATPWAGLTPYAAGQFVTLHLPAYAEGVLAGDNIFALNYASRNETASLSELGLRADRSFALDNAMLTLRGRAAWMHNFDIDRNAAASFQLLPQAGFVVRGATLASDAARTAASAELKWINGWSVAATFEGEFSGPSTSLAGKGTVSYQW